MQYEYKRHTIVFTDPEHMVELNALGQQGWRVVCVEPYEPEHRNWSSAILERVVRATVWNGDRKPRCHACMFPDGLHGAGCPNNQPVIKNQGDRLREVVRAARPIAQRLFHDVALMQPKEQAEVLALCDALQDLDLNHTEPRDRRAEFTDLAKRMGDPACSLLAGSPDRDQGQGQCPKCKGTGAIDSWECTIPCPCCTNDQRR